jgi:hypothetical protein
MESNKKINKGGISVFRYYGEYVSLYPCKVRRFIWHLSSPDFRDSINGLGLRKSGGLVFANNQNDNIMWMFPVWWANDQGFDRKYNDGDRKVWRELFDRFESGWDFDFWRIDTHKVKSEWYFDPNFPSYMDYVCTPTDIGREALELFTFDPEMSRKAIVKRYDGVARCSYSHLPLRRIDTMKKAA